jgi:hypothetical protein
LIPPARSAREQIFDFPSFKRVQMASDSHASNSGSGMDYPEHERTYGMFVGLVKWGTIGVVVLLIGMAIFLI